MRGFWLRFAILCMALWFGLRLVLALLLPEVPLGERLVAIAYGFSGDLQALALVCGLLALGFLTGRRFAVFWLALTAAAVAVVFIAEVLHWGEFQTRLGRLAIQYVRYVREVLAFVDEQVYLTYFLLPFAALAWFVGRRLARWLPEGFTRSQRLACVGWVAAAVAVLVFGRSVAPTEPLRPLNQLASNGYLEMLRALRIDLSQWQGLYWAPSAFAPADLALIPNKPPTEAGARTLLERPLALAADANVLPRPPADLHPRAPSASFKHLLLVIEESFGGKYWRDLHLRTKYMPEMQAIAAAGVAFDGVHSTGSRTVRGLEALFNSYPPLPGVGLPRDEDLSKLPSLPRALAAAGFHPIFVYGGWPGFTNLFDYWRSIGFQEMLEREDFAERKAQLLQRENCRDCWFETSWGVADEFLFDRVLKEMDRQTDLHERVFLATLTVSNHLPFDIPAGRIPFPSDQRRPEYAIAYADWALGRFIRQANRRPWLRETLIVVVADHGPDVPGAALLPADNFRVPMVFYSPANLTPEVIEHHGSTLSLPVTLLDLLALPTVESFYGWSLLRGETQVAPVEEDYHVGLLGPNHLTVLVRGGAPFGWRYDGRQLWPDQPDMAQARQAAALFGYAHERFYDGR